MCGEKNCLNEVQSFLSVRRARLFKYFSSYWKKTLLTILVVGRANAVRTRQLSRETGKNMAIGNLPGNFTPSLDIDFLAFILGQRQKLRKVSPLILSSLMFQKPIGKTCSGGLRWCRQMKLLTSPAKNWWQPSPSSPREARAPGLALGKPPLAILPAPLSCFLDRATTHRRITERVLSRAAIEPCINLDPSMPLHANFL